MRASLLKGKILYQTFLIPLPPKIKKEDGNLSNTFLVINKSLNYNFFILFLIHHYYNIFNRIYESKLCVCLIIGNETFEKLASMSLIANLVVYMHTQYNMDTTLSVEVFNIWAGLVNFIPLVAAYLADAYVGKFHMLIFDSIASLLVNTNKLS